MIQVNHRPIVLWWCTCVGALADSWLWGLTAGVRFVLVASISQAAKRALMVAPALRSHVETR